MRALTVTTDSRFAVTDLPDPEPRDGNVVVRVAACGICGSDLTLVKQKILPAGAILGHEAAGVIESVGAGVEGLHPGDAVGINPFDPCGVCDACRAGADQRCVNNATTTIGLGFRPGAYAELIEISAQMAVRVGNGAPVDRIAVAEPLAVALHGFRRSAFEPGMSVGVIGCGPIGLSAVLCAKALGASEVWAADTNEFRASLAERAGADEAGRTPGNADIVIEAAGAKGTVDLAVNSAVGGTGQVVLLAVNVEGDSIFPFVWVTKEVTIVPCLGYTTAEYAEAVSWIATGKVDVEPFITRRASLDEAGDAFFALIDGAPEGKVLVTP